MNKRRLLILPIMLVFEWIHAQPAIQMSYRYLRANNWDEIIQTYNTSRPWNNNKLEPVTHGVGAMFCWNFPLISSRSESLTSRALHLNSKLGYHQFGSSAENNNIPFKAGFHQFEVSIDLRTHPKCLFKPVQNTGALGTRYYIGFGASFNALMPFVRSNGDLISNGDGEKYLERTFHFSGQFNTGYHLLMIGNTAITVEIAAIWFGHAELEAFAESVNGHNLSGMRNESTSTLMIQGALRLTLLKANKNWWDNPRSGDKS